MLCISRYLIYHLLEWPPCDKQLEACLFFHFVCISFCFPAFGYRMKNKTHLCLSVTWNKYPLLCRSSYIHTLLCCAQQMRFHLYCHVLVCLVSRLHAQAQQNNCDLSLVWFRVCLACACVFGECRASVCHCNRKQSARICVRNVRNVHNFTQ